VLDPAKNDLSSEGHLAKKLFFLFSVFLHKNEYIPGVLSFKIKFSSKIDPPYSTSIHLQEVGGQILETYAQPPPPYQPPPRRVRRRRWRFHKIE
jgi:hypothetical protein